MPEGACYWNRKNYVEGQRAPRLGRRGWYKITLFLYSSCILQGSNSVGYTLLTPVYIQGLKSVGYTLFPCIYTGVKQCGVHSFNPCIYTGVKECGIYTGVKQHLQFREWYKITLFLIISCQFLGLKGCSIKYPPQIQGCH